MENLDSKRPVRSYVLRQGRMTPAQLAALEKLSPKYVCAPTALLSALTFPNAGPIYLDIGFGMGDSLCHYARQHPDKNFVGIEVHGPGVGRVLRTAEAESLENIRVYQADVMTLLNTQVAPSSIAGAFVFFPDPWPKKKHHKRRLVQTVFLDALARCIVPGGFLHLATDIDDYAEHMQAVAAAVAGQWGTIPVTQAKLPRPRTKFEAKAIKAGRHITDLLLIRRP